VRRVSTIILNIFGVNIAAKRAKVDLKAETKERLYSFTGCTTACPSGKSKGKRRTTPFVAAKGRLA
jgi:hypothetical protein